MLLHGRGADELDLLPLADAIDPQRRLMALFPRGPLALPPGGAHWYVLGGLGTPEQSSFRSSLGLLGGWLDRELTGAGVTIEHTVIGGFSQGAVMTAALGLGRGRPSPAGVAMLSGFLPTAEGFELDLASRAGLPALIAHGRDDRVIGVEFGRAARDRLSAAGLDVTYRESPTGHTIDSRVVGELRSWVHDRV